MPEEARQGTLPSSSAPALEAVHKLLLEALRHREQEIIRYLAILGPALGGFMWLLLSDKGDVGVFTVGTIAVLLLLLLGAIYSLALGYNYRYILLQLAKLETALQITDAMLEGWPRSPEDFLRRYKLWGKPWCTPPEVIKVFWVAFLVGILGVMVAACLFAPKALVLALVPPTSVVCLLFGLLLPFWYGQKLRKQCEEEQERGAWKPLVICRTSHSAAGVQGT